MLTCALVSVCSGPLPNGSIVKSPDFSNYTSTAPPDFFPALRAMNISHNRFTGTLPSAFGRSGVFTVSLQKKKRLLRPGHLGLIRCISFL